MYKKKPEKHAFQAFAEDLKADSIKNVNLMYGVEQYLVKWAVESLVKKYVNAACKSMDYVVLDEDSATVDSIIEACETFSMFSEKRVVWVRNFKPLTGDNVKGFGKSSLESLCRYIEAPNEGTIVVFSGEEIKESTMVAKTVKKMGRAYDFSPLGKAELSSFARKRFKAAGVDISPRLLAQLIDATGYNNRESDYRLFNFENDIAKIIAISNGVSITERDIEMTVCGDMDTFVFDMLDGISNGQKDKAFAVLYNMLNSGVDSYTIIGAIVSHFELMLSVKQMREDGTDLKGIHSRLGGSEYRIKKMIPYTNKYSADKLKRTLSDIYEVDRNIKTGILNDQLALEMFIARM